MAWPHDPLPPIRREWHYGQRVVPCFAERPNDLDAMLRAAALRNPDGDALVDGGFRLAWRELDLVISSAAAGLMGLGLSPGDRVALLLGNRWQFVVALLGAIRAGLVVVPMGVRLQTPELAWILADSGAAAILAEDELVPRLPATTAELVTLAGGFTRLLASDPATAPVVRWSEEDPAVILYTSGTTGRPKGAVLTQLCLVHSALHYEHCLALSAEDRNLVVVPMTHITGLVAGIVAMIRAGGAILVMRGFDAGGLLELAARERMTMTVMVPAMYHLCLMRADFAAHDLSAWRIGAYGGAPMPEATIAALADLLPGLELVNAYGATETTSPTTLMPFGMTHAHAASVGRVMPCGEVRIMDEGGREVRPGAIGEIWIAGPMVVPGYWNNPAATAAEFSGGFWRSGDVGRLDADGFLYVLDRLKDMINRGGYKVFSVEVENVLMRHPGVAEAAVVPRVDPVLGEKVQAFVHLREPRPDVDELRAHCAAHLADYKVPDHIVVMSEPLPRNANGKLLKRELRDRAGLGRG